MPAPLFLLVYFSLLTVSIGNPREMALFVVGVVLIKLLRHC